VREMLLRRVCACKLSPRGFLLREHRLQPTPSPLCGPAPWTLLGSMSQAEKEEKREMFFAPLGVRLNSLKYPFPVLDL